MEDMKGPHNGPWETPGTDGPDRVVSFRDRTGKRRTLAHVHGRTNAERDANARLIAVAPDMLAALEAWLAPDHTPETYDAALRLAHAARAKARGAA